MDSIDERMLRQAVADRDMKITELHQLLEVTERARAESEEVLETTQQEDAEMRRRLDEQAKAMSDLRETSLQEQLRLQKEVADVTTARDTRKAMDAHRIERLENEVEDARRSAGATNSETLKHRARIADLEQRCLGYRTAIRQLCAAIECAKNAVGELADIAGEDIPF